MLLLSVTLRHYRLHRELTVEFDRARTLIGGPNETGKSTLVEAIHRALFLRAKGTTVHHRSMESSTHGGKPEVELVFEAAGTRYRLHKRFSGTNGTITLTPAGGRALSGDEAESELARLLRVEPATTPGTVPQQWAHLWVWQGDSSCDPATHANAQRDTLLQRLGQSGGAALVMQSETDARVAAACAAQSEALFTQRGEPKATSELAKLTAELAQARERCSAAQERLQRVQEALATHARAIATLATLETNLANLTAQQTTLAARQAQLHTFRQRESTEAAAAQAAQAALLAHQQAEREILDLRARIDAARAELTPQEAELERFAQAAGTARLAADAASKAYDTASDAVRAARQEHELASAHVALLEKRQALAQLHERAASVAAIHATVARLRDELARLPEIDATQVKQLRKLEDAHATAAAALEAMAAGIEVLTSTQPVTLAGQPLPPGALQIITDDTELQVGPDTRIQIRPGGGSGLVKARQAAQDARRQLRAMLAELHVADSSAAQDLAQQRSTLASRIEAEHTRLKDLKAESLPAALEAARVACVAVETDLARCAAALDRPIPDAADLAPAQTAAATAAQGLQDAELAERRARAVRDTATKAHATAAEAHTQARGRIDQARRALLDLEAQLRLSVERHGDDTARHQRLTEATAAAQGAAAALAATQQAIAALQPEHLAADQARLDRALAAAKRTQQEAATQQAVAENTLRSDGSVDPQADLQLAQARVAALQERHASAARHAAAIQLLDELFRSEQQALADQYTRPLVDRVSAYLQCLFGPGARIDIRFEEQKFGPPALIRPALQHGAVPFEALSGGTQEQVAAAMRLAMAEVLAADHDGCLPIVFDDAFAFADPERVQTLQRMLDLAATRGLQVIILSCTPSDYAALGATAITLTRSPSSSSSLPSSTPPDLPSTSS